ncbi:AraC family transcriptional regulator [Paenarthrobacter sp. NPDC018779]|uniref:AraC family transcriptional regulator n=1 Tax=Paenarthrobacter sp. NPDC018779 TaxID=3364375 RepID=UPI0037C7C859
MTDLGASPVRLWGAPVLRSTPLLDPGVAPALTEPMVKDDWLLTSRTFSSGTDNQWPTEAHVEHELLWSTTGNVTVEAAGQLWLVPPVLGIWIPAGMPHRVRAKPGAVTCATYIKTGATEPGAWERISGVPLTPALKEVLMVNHLELMPDPKRLRLQQVAIDLVKPAHTAALEMPAPNDPALRRITDFILTHPGDDRTAADWAYSLNISSRTLMRRFKADSGLSLTQWRILARVRVALIDIGGGVPVVAVARRLGYANPSTFIDLFRQVTGHTPAAYFRSFGEGAEVTQLT